jgi:hypothetical protein
MVPSRDARGSGGFALSTPQIRPIQLDGDHCREEYAQLFPRE